MTARRGFTLVEMLVVIAIIAILAGILFPVFSRARAKARQTNCASNMQQVGTAIAMYAHDNAELLPAWAFGNIANNDNGPAQGGYTWDYVIQPYLKSTAVLHCPDSPFGGTITEGAYGEMLLRSYAMTRYTGDPWGGNRPGSAGYAVCPLDDPPLPTETVLLQEKGKRGIGIVGDAAAENFNQSHSSTGYGRTDEVYHNGGKSFLFLDGHAKWFPKTGGPFAAQTPMQCPPAEFTGMPLEGHSELGHCEFYTDWPQPQ
jgi:prepilin-type N-terminal cleavage/methylation domain-containing protein/prepilin-type processing-associated H-X9-DG protein